MRGNLNGATTLSIMTLSIRTNLRPSAYVTLGINDGAMTLIITTLSITTFNIMTLSIKVSASVTSARLNDC
jgi:hypothetical protein